MKLLFPAVIVFLLMSFQQDNASIRLFEEGFEMEFENWGYFNKKPIGKQTYIYHFSDVRNTPNGKSVTQKIYPYTAGKYSDTSFQSKTTIVLEDGFLANYPLKYEKNLKLDDLETEMAQKYTERDKKTNEVVNEEIKTIKSKCTNRIIGEEKILKTDAGEFKCYLVSEDIAVEGVEMITKMRTITWFNPELGVIKTEAFDTEGKPLSTTVLKKIKR